MIENETIVVNRRYQPYDVYIGRGSLFGNPYKIGRDGDRATVILLFRDYFERRLTWDFHFREEVQKLKGKRLGCWCKPDDCHGDVIAQYVDYGRFD